LEELALDLWIDADALPIETPMLSEMEEAARLPAMQGRRAGPARIANRVKHLVEGFIAHPGF
jgi:hypothetical protein